MGPQNWQPTLPTTSPMHKIFKTLAPFSSRVLDLPESSPQPSARGRGGDVPLGLLHKPGDRLVPAVLPGISQGVSASSGWPG